MGKNQNVQVFTIKKVLMRLINKCYKLLQIIDKYCLKVAESNVTKAIVTKLLGDYNLIISENSSKIIRCVPEDEFVKAMVLASQ